MPATLTLRSEQRDLLAQGLTDAVYYRDPQPCRILTSGQKAC